MKIAVVLTAMLALAQAPPLTKAEQFQDAARKGDAAAAANDFHRLALDAQVGRRDAAAAVDERELERLAVGQIGQAGLLNGRNVHEHILAAVIADNKAEAFLRVEEFDDALAFADDLRRRLARLMDEQERVLAALTALLPPEPEAGRGD